MIDMLGIRLLSVYNEDIRARSRTCRPSSRSRHDGRSPGCRPAIIDLITAMDEGRDPASPPESARETVAITQAILLSQARGNVEVQLEELAPAHRRPRSGPGQPAPPSHP